MNLRFVAKIEKFIVFYWRWGTEVANKGDFGFSILSNLVGPDQWIIWKEQILRYLKHFVLTLGLRGQ